MSRAMWTELVLGAVVAVLVIMFLSGSFQQNKDAQLSLTEYSNQTTDTIRLNLEDSGASIVSASYVINTISSLCDADNTTTIYVVDGTNKYAFLKTTTSDSALSTPTSLTATSATSLLSDLTDKYSKSTGSDSITFTLQ